MEEKELEKQKEAEKTAYQTFREEPKKSVETFDNKSITQIEKPSKKKKWIPIGIGIIIAIFFLLFGFFMLKIYPKYLLVKSLDTWTDSLDVLKEPMNHVTDYNFDEMTTKGTIRMQVSDFLLSNLGEEDESAKILEQLNSLSLDIESRISKKEGKAFLGFNGKMKDESFFNIGYRSEQDKQYLLLKDVLETYLELEEAKVKVDQNVDIKYYQENMEYVWKVFKKSFKKNLKLSYIKKSNETIEVDGKRVRTTKISLSIDEKIDAKITENIIKDLKKDKKANDFLVKLYPKFASYDKVEIKDSYEILYSVNVTKLIPKIVKVSFGSSDGSSITLVKGEDDIFELKEAEKSLFKIIIGEEKNGFKMKFRIEENNLEMVLTGTKENDTMIYHFTTETNGTSLETVLTLTKEKKGKDAFVEKGELELKAKAQGIELSILKMNVDFETTKGATFDEIKESKLITELTEEEQEKIKNYLDSFEKLFQIEETL